MANERWDDFLRYPREWSPRMSHRIKPLPQRPLPATLGEARQRHIWLWVRCARPSCYALLAMPLAPLIIRWGADAPLDVLASGMRCRRCGSRGARIAEPSWESGDLRSVAERYRWTGTEG